MEIEVSRFHEASCPVKIASQNISQFLRFEIFLSECKDTANQITNFVSLFRHCISRLDQTQL
jgi:hypothetical protein